MALQYELCATSGPVAVRNPSAANYRVLSGHRRRGKFWCSPKLTQRFIPSSGIARDLARLGKDLEREGIQPLGWVVDCSLTKAGVREPILAAKAATETTCIGEVFSVSDLTVILLWTSRPAHEATATERHARSGGVD